MKGKKLEYEAKFLCRSFHAIRKDINCGTYIICSNLLRKMVQMNISLRKINNEIQSHDLATAAPKSFVENTFIKKKTWSIHKLCKLLTCFMQNLEQKQTVHKVNHKEILKHTKVQTMQLRVD